VSEQRRPAARFPLPLDAVAARPVAKLAAQTGAVSKGSVGASAPGTEALAANTRGPTGPGSPRRTGPGAPATMGVGLDSSAVRERMVQRLRDAGGVAEVVLAAFAAVPRHRFVDSALVQQAYEDTALPIGLSQTISKPSVVARMLSLLCGSALAQGRLQQGQAKPFGRVLEIGSGCGYQAALLAQLSRSVVSVERLRALHEQARAKLDAIGVQDVRLVFGDGRLGHAPNAPFDAIVAAAGGEDLPSAWLDQLAVGGRLVAPMHDAQAGGQVLLVVDRDASGYHRYTQEGVHFVPLKFGTS
jgi:protein-L-isoaspartate(D-aspartate) O-methyltransferase